MCLVIVCKSGTDKYAKIVKKAIENSSVTNTDGMGFAFKRASTKRVYLSKGYKNVDAIWSELQSHKLKAKDELVIHLRNGNKGSLGVSMCHPFVCNLDVKEVMTANDKYVHDMVAVHNGTFYGYSEHNGFHSDTFNICNELFAIPEIQQLIKRNLPLFESSFRRVLGTNKLAFLFPDENQSLITIGNYVEKDGYLFSNDSYKDKTVINRGGYNGYSQYDYGYDHDRFGRNNHFNKSQNYYDAIGADEEYDDITDDMPFNTSSSSLNLIGRDIDELIGADEEEENLTYDPITNTFKAPLLGKDYQYSGEGIGDICFPTTVLAEDEFTCRGTGIRYRKLGNAYIPEQYKGNDQNKFIRVVVNEFNNPDLEFCAEIDDKDRGIEKYTYYILQEYEMGDDLNQDTDAPTLHTLIEKYEDAKGNKSLIYVSTDFLLRNFRVCYAQKVKRKYMDYFFLLSKFVLTKTTLVQVKKFLEADTHRTEDSVQFRGEPVKKASLYMFYFDLLKHLYPTDYKQKLTAFSV